MADSPVLTLLLEDLKRHMDEQIESARVELEETRQLKVEVDAILTGIMPDRWTEYETILPATAQQRLYRRRDRPITDQLDDIAAEG